MASIVNKVYSPNTPNSCKRLTESEIEAFEHTNHSKGPLDYKITPFANKYSSNS